MTRAVTYCRPLLVETTIRLNHDETIWLRQSCISNVRNLKTKSKRSMYPSIPCYPIDTLLSMSALMYPFYPFRMEQSVHTKQLFLLPHAFTIELSTFSALFSSLCLNSILQPSGYENIQVEGECGTSNTTRRLKVHGTTLLQISSAIAIQVLTCHHKIPFPPSQSEF